MYSKIKNHNVTALTLIRNKDFHFTNQNDVKIYFNVPNFEEYLVNTNLSLFFSLLELDRSKYAELDVNSNEKMLLFLIKNQMYTEEIALTLHRYIPGIKIELQGFFVKDEYITPDELDFMIDVWKIAIGAKNLEQWLDQTEKKEEPIDEFEKMIQEREAKVRKIKQNKKEEQQKTQLEQIVVTVMKEFSLKIEDILKMNLFTIFWHYYYALKFSNYRVETIAFGNGLLKQYKHFSE